MSVRVFFIGEYVALVSGLYSYFVGGGVALFSMVVSTLLWWQ
jgi:LytS/YehU family sensor histidine kinase